jgi:hypothetical protein
LLGCIFVDGRKLNPPDCDYRHHLFVLSQCNGMLDIGRFRQVIVLLAPDTFGCTRRHVRQS